MKSRNLFIHDREDVWSLVGVSIKTVDKLLEDSVENYDKIFIRFNEKICDKEFNKLTTFLNKDSLGDFMVSRKNIVLIGDGFLSSNKRIFEFILGNNIIVKNDKITRLIKYKKIPIDFRRYIDCIRGGNFFVDTDQFKLNEKCFFVFGGKYAAENKKYLDDLDFFRCDVENYVYTGAGYSNCFTIKLKHKYNKKYVGVGEITFLPDIDNKGDALYLQEILKIAMEGNNYVEGTDPSWMGEYMFGDEFYWLDKIDAQEIKVKKAEERLEELWDSLIDAIECKEVLWSKGHDLEYYVKLILNNMKINLSEFEDNGREDLLVTLSKNQKLLFEVKSKNKGSLGIDSVRQITDWKWDHQDKGFNVKGVLVANSEMDLSPVNRKNPFSNEIKAYSIKHDICYLTTYTLFKWYLMIDEGFKTTEEFISAVIMTKGELKGDFEDELRAVGLPMGIGS